jgi:TRAP-type C4-dicarboxylate transport system permease small subunit
MLGRAGMVPEPRDGTRGDEYLSYMLRLWQESVDEPVEVDGAPVWRASLTSPITGERLGFATLDDLVEYLHHQVDASTRTDAEERRKRR